jgi:transcriptional regulator GlxA family with amidase domain
MRRNGNITVLGTRDYISQETLDTARKFTSSSELPKMVKRNRTTFWLAFHVLTGRSPKQHVIMLSVAKAIEFIRSKPQLLFVDIAQLSGFSDEPQMCRRCVEWTGLTPGKIRKAWRVRCQTGAQKDLA